MPQARLMGNGHISGTDSNSCLVPSHSSLSRGGHQSQGPPPHRQADPCGLAPWPGHLKLQWSQSWKATEHHSCQDQEGSAALNWQPLAVSTWQIFFRNFELFIDL